MQPYSNMMSEDPCGSPGPQFQSTVVGQVHSFPVRPSSRRLPPGELARQRVPITKLLISTLERTVFWVNKSRETRPGLFLTETTLHGGRYC